MHADLQHMHAGGRVWQRRASWATERCMLVAATLYRLVLEEGGGMYRTPHGILIWGQRSCELAGVPP